MLLQVKNLTTQFKVKRGIVNAVDGVSFEIDKGEVWLLLVNQAAVRV